MTGIGAKRNLDIGGLFGGNNDPAPIVIQQPPAPVAPPAPPTDDQAALTAQAERQRQLDARRAAGSSAQGPQETLLTGGEGVSAGSGKPKTLLGE